MSPTTPKPGGAAEAFDLAADICLAEATRLRGCEAGNSGNSWWQTRALGADDCAKLLRGAAAAEREKERRQ